MVSYKENYINNQKINVMQLDNRSTLARKDFIWIEIEFYENEFFVSSKLTNYFAQLEERSSERIEKINNYVLNTYKALDFNYLFFKNIPDNKEDSEIEFLENNIIPNELEELIEVFENEFENINFKEYEDISHEENINVCLHTKSDEFEENVTSLETDADDYVQFFVPLSLATYRGTNKKSDFFLANEFNFHLFFKDNIVSIRNNIIVKKFLNKKYIFKKNYISLKSEKIRMFNNFKSGFFKLINNSNILFLKKKYFVNKAHRYSKKSMIKRKKKLNMFKKFNLKRKIEKNIILKNFKWFSSVYLSILLETKSTHSFEDYSHFNYVNNLYNFLCQIKSMESKFYRVYRRRRRLKKNFFRNFEGKLGKLNKEINDKEDNSKLKYKRKRGKF